MLRRCDGTDPYLTAEDGTPCRCGMEFDDVHRIVTFPHVDFTAAKARWTDAWVGEVSPVADTGELPASVGRTYPNALLRAQHKAETNGREYVVYLDRLATDRGPGSPRYYVRAAQAGPPDPDRYLVVHRFAPGA